MEGGGDNDYARSTLGDTPEIHLDMAADQIGDGPVASFDLGYELADKRRVIEATGTTLELSVWPPDQPRAQMTSTFNLPTDAAQTQAMTRPCLDALERQAAEEAAKTKRATVLECPTLEGKALVSTKILMGPNRKSSRWMGESEGTGWALPTASKAHLRPRLMSRTSAVADRSVMPLPLQQSGSRTLLLKP